MKLIAPTLLLTLAAVAAPATSLAQCTGTPLTQLQLNTLLSGNTVCGRPVIPGYPGDASDRWQEQHLGGSVLVDYKMGAGHAVDPSKPVGDWTVSSTDGTGLIGTVRHRYPAGGATAFIWQVFGPPTNTPVTSVYSFCTVATTPVEQVRAHVRLNAVSCANTFP